MTEVVGHPHVAFDQDIGRWTVKGTKVPAFRLYAWHKRGTTFEMLFKRYPQLGPSHILDAVSFVYDNLDLLLKEADEVHEEPSQRKLPF